MYDLVRLRCEPFARRAWYWVKTETDYAAWLAQKPPEPATEAEVLRARLAVVDEINQAVPINGGKPAIDFAEAEARLAISPRATADA